MEVKYIQLLISGVRNKEGMSAMTTTRVPSLTYDGKRRNKLVGNVNAATFSANSSVLLIAFVIVNLV